MTKTDTCTSFTKFTECVVEFGVYVRWRDKSDVIIIFFHVSVLLVTTSNHAKIERFKGKFTSEFEMSDLGSHSFSWDSNLFITMKESSCIK